MYTELEWNTYKGAGKIEWPWHVVRYEINYVKWCKTSVSLHVRYLMPTYHLILLISYQKQKCLWLSNFINASLYLQGCMISNIYHFISVVALHDRTVRCVLVIVQGNFRLGRLYVCCSCWGIWMKWPAQTRTKWQWRGALMFSSISVWINGWVNSGGTGDLRRHRAHYDVIVMDIHNYSWLQTVNQTVD